MSKEKKTIRLYTAQTQTVVDVIERDGVCYSKEEYVRKKYQESAKVFVAAYSWFVREAEKIVPKPEGAEYPYWAFMDLYNVEASGAQVQVLEVPIDEVIFFDLMDWNRIMQMGYIGENEKDEKAFRAELSDWGIRSADAMLTNFYPDFKRRIEESWKRLFRHHEAIKNGDKTGVHGVQAGLWRIKKEWIVE